MMTGGQVNDSRSPALSTNHPSETRNYGLYLTMPNVPASTDDTEARGVQNNIDVHGENGKPMGPRKKKKMKEAEKQVCDDNTAGVAESTETGVRDPAKRQTTSGKPRSEAVANDENKYKDNRNDIDEKRERTPSAKQTRDNITQVDRPDPYAKSGRKLQEGPAHVDGEEYDDDAYLHSATDLGGGFGKDEVDNKSIWSEISYYMKKDFRYYFQHPYARIFVAYFVTFCNFLIFAEDPVSHSIKVCTIPVIGNVYAFVLNFYPASAWSLLKIVMWVIAIIAGVVFGKLVVHRFLLCRLMRLRMFRDEQGSWMVMFLTSLLSLFIFANILNLFYLLGGDELVPYKVTGEMGIKNATFMKAAACGTWMGDFVTAWMVTDMMLQDKLYPGWARRLRAFWGRGYNRIILFWVVWILMTLLVVMIITTDWINWDNVNRDFLPTNEVSRAFLASFILVMDLLIVMQDWDFPHFESAFDIKLPGVNTSEFKFKLPACLRRDSWQIHITGKWFNYGIIFLVMILDLNMWKNQIFYFPYDYGQYIDNDGRVMTITDTVTLETHNATIMTHAWRSNNINPLTNRTFVADDFGMNSRYYDFALAIKAMAFIPSLACFVVFGIFVWWYGRFQPDPNDPHAGRLFKRRKKKNKDKTENVKLTKVKTISSADLGQGSFQDNAAVFMP
ncbi:transmembrane protein 117-like isoform X2 [Glandiceps talaboti]